MAKIVGLLVVLAVLQGWAQAGTPLEAAPQTITFNDKSGQDQNLNGQYPTGVVNWGSNVWYHSAPWGQFTTKSISFRTGSQTSGIFTFITPQRLVSLKAYNGGSGSSTITIACSGQTTKSQAVPAGQLVTISTGWTTGTCGAITMTSSNGWDTNFDDIIYDSAPAGPADPAPTIVQAAAASPSPATGTTTGLSVTASDNNGEPALTYTWSMLSGPASGTATFSPNGTNAAKSSTATFNRAGAYTLRVTVADANGNQVTSQLTVNVNQTLTSVAVTPTSASVPTNGSQQFSASGTDQFAQPMSPQPTFTWTVSGGGTINSSGLFTAGAAQGGPHTVTATSGSRNGTATLNVATVSQTQQTITFNDKSGQDQNLTGQYPTGVVDWGSTSWYHSAPWGQFTTKSISFRSGSQTSGIFTFITPQRLVSLKAYNGGSGSSTITIACSGQTTKSQAVPAGQLVTISTGWTTGTCGAITVTSSNGWNTNFDDIIYDSGAPADPAPTIVQPAAASPSPATGTTTGLSVTASDNNGEPALTYTWSMQSGPASGTATFSPNGNNAAKSSTATFNRAGAYTLRVTVADANGNQVTSQLTVNVNQTLASIAVTPATASVPTGGSQQFSASGTDQFAQPMSPQPTFTWTVGGGGSINSSGLFTAGATQGGPHTVTATSGSQNATATLNVTASDDPPTVATAASGTPNPTTTTTSQLAVLGADDQGEPALTYTWSLVLGPSSGDVSFSANGNNAAKNTTASFTRAGLYTLRASIRDAANQTVTSDVTVNVNQTLTSVAVSPASAGVQTGGGQQFSASGTDQFAQPMNPQPTFTWTVGGGGSINSSGLFTAGSTAGGPHTVTATSGSHSGTATVTVTAVSQAPQTITFNDKSGQDQPLNGQYPTGVVDWGSGSWYHSSPWGQFTTKSISFLGGFQSATFTFLTPQRLISLKAYNGGSGPSTVTVGCFGQTTKTESVPNGQLVTIPTGWTSGTCSIITLTSSNGWDTNFDDFVYDSGTPPPPAVSIVQPAEGSTVGGPNVLVNYAKSGDMTSQGIDHAHIYLDGANPKMDLDFDGFYTLTNVPAGNHTIRVVLARSDHSETNVEDTVNVTVSAPETTPPTVAITAPANGATISGTVTVLANASDNVAVSGVQFKLDGTNLGVEDTTSPYEISLNTTTISNGQHTLTAVARDLSSNQTTSSDVTVTVNNSDARSVVGEWGSVLNWPIVAIHSSLLCNGKVLMWDEQSVTVPRLWDPVTNTMSSTSAIDAYLFCSAQITLDDGRLLVVGGHSPVNGQIGIKDTYLYDPDANTWTRTGDMLDARWYPSLAKLNDGRVAIFSGQKLHGVYSDRIEIYDPATGMTSEVAGVSTPELHEEEYAAMHNLPNGKILAISAEHGPVQLYDHGSNSWTNVNQTPISLGSTVQYRPGQILMSGGGPSFGSNASGQAAVLDMNVGAPSWAGTSPMNTPRYFHSFVMLPTGEALAVGGAAQASQFSLVPVMQPEMWNPDTGAWTTLASHSVPRMYHSTALLLPDGRVLSAGGGRLGHLTNETSAQVYSPPYLFKGPRPTLSSAPAEVDFGTNFTINSPDANDIVGVTMVSLAANTHSADFNQIYRELSFTKSSGQITVSAPANVSQVPAGCYMVFAINSNGVPSEAKIITFSP